MFSCSPTLLPQTTCPHCDATKNLLHGKGVDFKLVELDQLTAGANVQNVLQEMTQARTVPRIFIGGQVSSLFTKFTNTFSAQNTICVARPF